MKDKKGFTLIELLVAITIIGIIMIMTLPAIHNLQRENQEKKFDDYERTVLEAAKVYEDQYEEDLFGRSDTGCAHIDFDSLVQKKLLATTKISGYECKNSNNGIIIRKIKGTSYYEVYLTCDNGKPSGKKNLTGNTGDYNEIKKNHCNTGADEEPPQLTIKCDGANPPVGVEDDNFDGEIYYYSATNTEGTKRIPQLTVEISDKIVGLEKNQYVTYEWKMYPNKILSEKNPEYTEKNKTTFNIKDGDRSTSKKNVRIIEQFKKPETTGKAIVDIRGTNIVDRIGNKLDPNTAFEQCYYYYDNAKPEMEIKITGNNSGREYSTTSGEWINEPITTTVTVTDKTPNDIYSGIDMNSFKNSNISGAKLSEKDGNAVHTYTLVDTNRKQNDKYTVCDKVGNCISQTVKIRVDTTYPKCKSRDGDSNWRNTNITINGDCEDQGNPAHYSGCRQNVYSQVYSAEQSITNATAGEACDNAGNCVTCSQDQPVHIDKTRPDCTTDGETTDWATTRTIKYNCEDPISGGVRSNCTQTTSESITYESTTKTTSKTWNIKDNAGNTRTCTKSDVEVYVDISPPICSYEVKNQKSPGNQATISFKCVDNDSGVGLFTPYANWFSADAKTYPYKCENKAHLLCETSVTIKESTCDKCPYECCKGDWYEDNGRCCKTYEGLKTLCNSMDTCYKTCTSAKYCGYEVSAGGGATGGHIPGMNRQ